MIKKNFTKGRNGNKIQYIVLHYVAGTSSEGTANNVYNYFNTTDRQASAHYVVDDFSVVQCVDEKNTAWHCGARTYKHKCCRNENSIGIEMCNAYNKDWGYFFTKATLDNAKKLVVELVKKYNIPVENIIRHYDVTGKNCPAPMVQNTKLYNDFINEVRKGV